MATKGVRSSKSGPADHFFRDGLLPRVLMRRVAGGDGERGDAFEGVFLRGDAFEGVFLIPLASATFSDGTTGRELRRTQPSLGS